MATDETVIGGVQAFSVAGHGPLQARLVFLVGSRDEQYIASGITHVIEHLALDGLPEPVYPTNGVVEAAVTRFEFSGPDDVVADSLTRLARSLRRILDGQVSDDELAKAVSIIRAEGPALSVPPALAEAAAYSVGLRGAGLVAGTQDRLEHLTVDEVAAYARRFFVRENAMLFCVGEPPRAADFTCLPAGERNDPPARAAPVVPGPCEYVSEGPNASVAFRVPAGDPVLDVLRIGLLNCLDRQLQRELRSRDGLIYSVETCVFQLSDAEDLVQFVFDPRPQHAVRVLHAALEIIRQVRDAGPAESLVDDVVKQIEHELLVPEHHVDAGYDVAMSWLLQQRHYEGQEVIDRLRRRTADEVRRCFSAFEDTLLVGLPERAVGDDVDPRTGHIAPLRAPQAAPPIEGTRFGRSAMARLHRIPRSTELIVGEAGIRLTQDDETICAAWDAVVALDVWEGDDRPEGVTVLTDAAFEAEIAVPVFKRGAEAVRMIRERVPARLQVRRFDDTTA